MAYPRSRRLFLIGATMLTAGAPVLADNHSEKTPEASTVVYGPQVPTPAEIAKFNVATPVTPAPDAALATVLPKAAEVTTIVIGPAGLTAQELAKASASLVPVPSPSTTTTPASTPAPTTTTPAPAENK